MTPEEFEATGKRIFEEAREKYEQVDGEFKCKNCGGEILAVKRAHPIHNGPFPLSGSGKCAYMQIPYCPACEEEPSSRGAPINPKGSYANR